MEPGRDMTDDLVLWDVIEEHLEEGAFQLQVWRDALRSPLYTLDEVANGPEELLRAHVDGLVIGGGPVAARVLLPTLAEPEEPELGVVAALALLGQGRTDAVMKALRSESAEAREAARQALEIDLPTRLERAVVARAPLLPPGPERASLARIAAARGLPLPDLGTFLQGEEPTELAAAAALAVTEPAHLPRLEALLAHAVPAVVEAALPSALTLGSARAWAWCRETCRGAEAPTFALELLAMLGDPDDHRRLLALLDRPERLPDALMALRFSGRADLAPRLLDLMEASDPLLARLAGEAFSTITGLDLSEDPYIDETAPPDEDLPELDDDDLEADLVPPAEDELPLPVPAAVREWWQRHGGALDTRRRLLHGQPWTPEAALDLLERGPARRREGVARWLQVHSGGRARVSTVAWTARQRQQVAEARCRLREIAWRGFTIFQELGHVGD